MFKGQEKGKTNGNSGPALEAPPHKCTPEEVHVTFNLVFSPRSVNIHCNVIVGQYTVYMYSVCLVLCYWMQYYPKVHVIFTCHMYMYLHGIVQLYC